MTSTNNNCDEGSVAGHVNSDVSQLGAYTFRADARGQLKIARYRSRHHVGHCRIVFNESCIGFSVVTDEYLKLWSTIPAGVGGHQVGTRPMIVGSATVNQLGTSKT